MTLTDHTDVTEGNIVAHRGRVRKKSQALLESQAQAAARRRRPTKTARLAVEDQRRTEQAEAPPEPPAGDAKSNKTGDTDSEDSDDGRTLTDYGRREALKSEAMKSWKESYPPSTVTHDEKEICQRNEDAAFVISVDEVTRARDIERFVNKQTKKRMDDALEEVRLQEDLDKPADPDDPIEEELLEYFEAAGATLKPGDAQDGIAEGNADAKASTLAAGTALKSSDAQDAITEVKADAKASTSAAGAALKSGDAQDEIAVDNDDAVLLDIFGDDNTEEQNSIHENGEDANINAKDGIEGGKTDAQDTSSKSTETQDVNAKSNEAEGTSSPSTHAGDTDVAADEADEVSQEHSANEPEVDAEADSENMDSGDEDGDSDDDSDDDISECDIQWKAALDSDPTLRSAGLRFNTAKYLRKHHLNDRVFNNSFKPVDLFPFLTHTIPLLVLGEKGKILDDELMKEFCKDASMYSQLSRHNGNFGKHIIPFLAQALVFNHKGYHARIPKSINWPDEVRDAVRHNARVLLSVLSSAVSGKSPWNRVYPQTLAEINVLPIIPESFMYKIYKGIALSYEAYEQYKKEYKQQQLMFPNHVYFLHKLTSFVKISSPADLVNYEELSEDSTPTKSEAVSANHKGPPYVCFGGDWKDIFEFKEGEFCWKGNRGVMNGEAM